jgi:ADP-ribosylglycohydrolase
MHLSLDGLSVGDALGERFFFEQRAYQLDVWELPPAERPVPHGPWAYTDDTQMALSIVEVLSACGTIDQDRLAASFAAHFEHRRGYGPAMYQLLPRMRAGQPWQHAARALFGGRGSFGNGGAMRIAPLGAFFADDVERVVVEARRATEVTHAHPEAIAGAIAVAVAAAYASQGRERPTGIAPDLIALVLPHVPPSVVRDRLAEAMTIPSTSAVWTAVKALGNGSGITAQDTVPFVLWCAAQHLDSYVDAIWHTISALGDIDTNCAMVGGIVACATGSDGIPSEWLRRRERLPAWPLPARST